MINHQQFQLNILYCCKFKFSGCVKGSRHSSRRARNLCTALHTAQVHHIVSRSFKLAFEII